MVERDTSSLIFPISRNVEVYGSTVGHTTNVVTSSKSFTDLNTAVWRHCHNIIFFSRTLSLFCSPAPSTTHLFRDTLVIFWESKCHLPTYKVALHTKHRQIKQEMLHKH